MLDILIDFSHYTWKSFAQFLVSSWAYTLYESAWVLIAKYHRLNGFNNSHFSQL